MFGTQPGTGKGNALEQASVGRPKQVTRAMRHSVFRRGDMTPPRIFVAVAALAILLDNSQALAQQWPDRPLRLIVPFPAGGNTDGVARITGDWLSKRLGQPVTVDNKPGASGTIAAELVARSAPDGYTLFVAASVQLVIVPHVQKISYDPVKDFAPISIVADSLYALGLNSNVPAKSLREFVHYVRARPGQLNYAAAGSGTGSHLAMALFLSRADLKMEAVFYKGGAPAMTDVLAGHVPAYFGNVNELLPHARSDQIKILAVSGERRAPQLPDVPTVAEQGYPGFRIGTWNSVVAPRATPLEIIDRLAREIGEGCKDADFVARLVKIGGNPVCNRPAEFSKVIRQELEETKEAVIAAGITPPQ